MAAIVPVIKHGLLVGALIAGIVSAGCQPSVPLDNTVCEYQPGKPATQINIEDQGVFSLLRRDKLTSEGLATEIERTDVDGGSKLGFAMNNQQLIAIAGPTTWPLETGSYSWQALTETAGTRKLREQHEKETQHATAAFILLVGAPIVVATALFCAWLVSITHIQWPHSDPAQP